MQPRIQTSGAASSRDNYDDYKNRNSERSANSNITDGQCYERSNQRSLIHSSLLKVDSPTGDRCFQGSRVGNRTYQAKQRMPDVGSAIGGTDGELAHVGADLHENGLRERLTNAFHCHQVHAGKTEQVRAHVEARLVLAFEIGLDAGTSGKMSGPSQRGLQAAYCCSRA